MCDLLGKKDEEIEQHVFEHGNVKRGVFIFFLLLRNTRLYEYTITTIDLAIPLHDEFTITGNTVIKYFKIW